MHDIMSFGQGTVWIAERWFKSYEAFRLITVSQSLSPISYQTVLIYIEFCN